MSCNQSYYTAFGMCLPLTQFDTTHVPYHSETQGRLVEGFTGPTPAQKPLVTPKSRIQTIYAVSLYLSTSGPPCRPPGLCSFPVDVVVPQVDVPHSFVDLQGFGEGLWPDDGAREDSITTQSTKTFVTPVKLSCHGGHQQESQVQ